MKRTILLLALLAFAPAVLPQTMWFEHVIRPEEDGGTDLQHADVNNDGRVDLLVASRGNDRIAWFENLDNQFNFLEHIVVADFDDARNIRPADFNEDGHVDLITLAQYDHDVRLYWNLGDGLSWDLEIIGPDIPISTDLEVADLDNDGDTDIIISEDYLIEGLIWYENVDHGISWIRHEFDWGMNRLDDIEVIDVDLDGDLDVVTCGEISWDDEINWFENLGGGLDWTYHSIALEVEALFIRAGDIRGDGTVSVAAVTWGGLKVWHDTMQNGEWVETVVDPHPFGTYISLADFDQDGDLDLSASYASLQSFAWFENRGEQDWRPHQINSQHRMPGRQAAFDLSGDSYPDFIESTTQNGAATVWENNLANVDFAITVRPRDLPIRIDPGGGNFAFHWHAWNRTAQVEQVDVWGEIRFTSGELVRSFNVHPGIIIPADWMRGEVRWEYIPFNMPAGDFHFIANLGTWPDEIVAADTFEVMKYPRPMSEPTSGMFMEKPLSGDFALDCTPNPFNAMTIVRVALPQESQLSVAVYNTVGQQVAELVNGQVEAGSHAYTLDATNLASGLYFVHATVPGELNTTQKVMLVR
jgi:FG-GAP-like repeat/Secretion system C-terminal sorting domain